MVKKTAINPAYNAITKLDRSEKIFVLKRVNLSARSTNITIRKVIIAIPMKLFLNKSFRLFFNLIFLR